VPGTMFPGPGDFGVDQTSGDAAILTDGVLGYTKPVSVSCGPGGTGNYVTYYLQTNSSPLGFEITNVTVYAGWLDSGRRDQAYEILYATVAQPTNFISLFQTQYLPDDPSGVSISSCTKLIPLYGVLAHNVYALKVNWVVPQFLNGYSLYDEIEVGGTSSATIYTPVLPSVTSMAVSGTNLVVSGTGGTANATYTWLGTTDLTPPITWVPVLQGVLNGSGAMSSSLPITTDTQMFFRLRMP